MVDKKGLFNFADFDLDQAYEMIDDKMARNMADDIRKQLGPNGLSKHKPIVSGPGGIPLSSGRAAVH